MGPRPPSRGTPDYRGALRNAILHRVRLTDVLGGSSNETQRPWTPLKAEGYEAKPTHATSEVVKEEEQEMQIAAEAGADVTPASVVCFFDSIALKDKVDTIFDTHFDENIVLGFIGPYAPSVPLMKKKMLREALDNLIASFPDFTFNSTSASVTRSKDGGFSADIVVSGTHSGEPFTPDATSLPPVQATHKKVDIGPETFTLYVNEAGKICKVTIEALEKDKPSGPPGFYTEIGGMLEKTCRNYLLLPPKHQPPRDRC